MLQSTRRYFEEASESIGSAWNCWWFVPRDASSLAALRIAVGLITLYWLATLGTDLVYFFGAGGLLPSDVIRQVAEIRGRTSLSYLHWLSSPAELWVAHGAALAVALLFTVGLFTRVTSVLTLVAFLATAHRGSVLTGILEPVLAFTLLYLCIAPCGARFSVDAWRRVRTGHSPSPASVSANVATRLLQLHVALVYGMMGITMLSGPTDSWWMGDAMWFLIARPESRIVDMTWLDDHTYLLNFWTHWVVFYELAFATFVWNRWARPVLLLLGMPHWLMLALVSGLAPFCVLMLALNLAYVPPSLFAEKSFNAEPAATVL
jgi:hypothetical protein